MTPSTTRVRFDCRFSSGTTTLYADLTDEALAAALSQLHGYQAGTIPPYALVAVVARSEPDRDDDNGYREFRVWRVVRVISVTDEVVLYQRTRTEPVATDDHHDGVVVTLTPTQCDQVKAGTPVRFDVPAEAPYSTPLVVIVRVGQER